MDKHIDFYLSLISPWSYLAYERLLAMADKKGVGIKILPVDLSVIFPRTGGIPLPQRSQQRKDYRMSELKRWRSHLDIPLTLEPAFFPVSDKLAAFMVIALREENSEQALHLAGACLRAVWQEERDISDRDTLLAIAGEQQVDGEMLLSKSEAALETMVSDTQIALERGVFGVPSFIYDGELFWGQDRLDFLERALNS